MSMQRGNPRPPRRDEVESEFKEEVVHINRVSKVVKGGRKFYFTALVVVGDGKNRVGLGYGKAGEIVDAIKKGVDDAKRQMITLVMDGTTIPYEVRTTYCSSKVILKPAAKGHGIIAGGSARPLLALGGLEDVTAKFTGSNNPVNCARAAFQALKEIKSADYIRRMRNGEQLDSRGRFVSESRKSQAEEALDQIAEDEAEANRETEERLSKPAASQEETAGKPAADDDKAAGEGSE
jgi:small subunit ribosomal protein S5